MLNLMPQAVPWVLLAAILVMFMQAGFSLVDTGMCRAKNAAHTGAMSLLGFALSVMGMLLSGYGIISGRGYLLRGLDMSLLAGFVFLALALSISSLILAGALAERWSFKSIFAFTLLASAVLFPVYGQWVWGGGFLARLPLGQGVVDYAGGSVIHLQGGMLALAASYLLGPRIGKFDAAGHARPIFAHHIPMVTLGTFVLAFGWFALHAGFSLAAGDGRLPLVIANTLTAAAAATVAGVAYTCWKFGKPDPSMMCNSLLAGLVAVSASCAYISPGGALVIGAVAGVLVVLGIFFLDRIHIDDPVGAISIHGINGIWGMLALGLFATGDYGQVGGLFYQHGLGQLGAQGVGVAVCLAWNLVAGGGAFWAVGKMVGGNRVAPEIELAGLDVPEVGAPGYPEFFTSISPEQVDPHQVAIARREIKALAEGD